MMPGEQLGFWEDDGYKTFTEKFKPKRTTDDCYTPPEIFEVVADWACDKYGFCKDDIVRPFFPGGDFANYAYPAGCVVLDNPPFSILSQIIDFYLRRNIRFFLFAPTLTNFSGRKNATKITHIICNAKITYANGAVVNTSFVTNLGGDIVAQSEPELTARINAAVDALHGASVKAMQKYKYPSHVLTAAMLQYMAGHGVAYAVSRADVAFTPALDAQRCASKTIFGAGFLLSHAAAAEKAAAEKAAAEKAAAEKAAAEKAAAEKAEAIEWGLSDREMEIIRGLGRADGNRKNA